MSRIVFVAQVPASGKKMRGEFGDPCIRLAVAVLLDGPAERLELFRRVFVRRHDEVVDLFIDIRQGTPSSGWQQYPPPCIIGKTSFLAAEQTDAQPPEFESDTAGASLRFAASHPPLHFAVVRG